MYYLEPRRLYAKLQLLAFQWLNPTKITRPISLAQIHPPDVLTIYNFRIKLSPLNTQVVDYLLRIYNHNWVELLYCTGFGNLADEDSQLEIQYKRDYPERYRIRGEYFGMSLVRADRSLWYLCLLTDFLDRDNLYYTAFTTVLRAKYKAVALGLFFTCTKPPNPLTIIFTRPLVGVLKSIQPKNRSFIRWGMIHIRNDTLQEKLPEQWRDCIMLDAHQNLIIKLPSILIKDCMEASRTFRRTLQQWWIHTEHHE